MCAWGCVGSVMCRALLEREQDFVVCIVRTYQIRTFSSLVLSLYTQASMQKNKRHYTTQHTLFLQFYKSTSHFWILQPHYLYTCNYNMYAEMIWICLKWYDTYVILNYRTNVEQLHPSLLWMCLWWWCSMLDSTTNMITSCNIWSPDDDYPPLNSVEHTIKMMKMKMEIYEVVFDKLFSVLWNIGMGRSMHGANNKHGIASLKLYFENQSHTCSSNLKC